MHSQDEKLFHSSHYGVDEECSNLMEDIKAMDKLLKKADAHSDKIDLVLEKLDELDNKVSPNSAMADWKEMWSPGYELYGPAEPTFYSDDDVLFSDQMSAIRYAQRRYSAHVQRPSVKSVQVTFNR